MIYGNLRHLSFDRAAYSQQKPPCQLLPYVYYGTNLNVCAWNADLGCPIVVSKVSLRSLLEQGKYVWVPGPQKAIEFKGFDKLAARLEFSSTLDLYRPKYTEPMNSRDANAALTGDGFELKGKGKAWRWIESGGLYGGFGSNLASQLNQSDDSENYIPRSMRQ